MPAADMVFDGEVVSATTEPAPPDTAADEGRQLDLFAAERHPEI